MQHLKRIKNESYYQSALLLYFNNVSNEKKKGKLIPYRKYRYMQQMVALL